jgi:hypothetical protein
VALVFTPLLLFVKIALPPGYHQQLFIVRRTDITCSYTLFAGQPAAQTPKA